MTTKLKEKDIVTYIVDNWDKYFPELIFKKTEFQARSDYRCDILCFLEMNLREYGYDEDGIHYAGIYTEVKYNSPSRDLIFELEKAIDCCSHPSIKHPRYVAVIMDDYSDETILNYLIENDIIMWKIDIVDDNLEEMKIYLYEPDEFNVNK